ncbi:hypothetical protein D9M71_624510 [compost metagenome]
MSLMLRVEWPSCSMARSLRRSFLMAWYDWPSFSRRLRRVDWLMLRRFATRAKSGHWSYGRVRSLRRMRDAKPPTLL